MQAVLTVSKALFTHGKSEVVFSTTTMSLEDFLKKNAGC